MRSKLPWAACVVASSFLLGCFGQDHAGMLADHVRSSAPEGDVKAALNHFIEFSEQNGLGMHLGREKGDHLEIAVAQGLPEKGPATVLEMGCHAGDGTLSAIFAVLNRPGSTIVSTEGNEEWLEAAKKVVNHATARWDLTFIPKSFEESGPFEDLLDELRSDHGIVKFDAVVLDHDEKFFLPHLKAILKKGMLREGGVVYVDNVKRKAKQLRDYMGFVHSDSKNGFQTVTKAIKKPYPDAVAISTFVGSSTEL